MKAISAVTLLAACLSTASAVADDTFSDFGPNNSFMEVEAWRAGGDTDIAQQFQAGESGELIGFTSAIADFNGSFFESAGVQPFTLSLYSDPDANPNSLGSLLGSWNDQTDGGSVNSPDPVNVLAASGVYLQAGQSYWLDLSAPESSDIGWNTNVVNFGTNVLVSGVHFQTGLAVAAAFSVQVQPAPEPETILSFTGLFAGALLLKRRKR
jgi:hypothetical protein